MDTDVLQPIFTVMAFLTFGAIVLWAYSARARPGFEEAARLPFVEEDARGDGGPGR